MHENYMFFPEVPGNDHRPDTINRPARPRALLALSVVHIIICCNIIHSQGSQHPTVQPGPMHSCVNVRRGRSRRCHAASVVHLSQSHSKP
jgi:hypothetical protein